MLSPFNVGLSSLTTSAYVARQLLLRQQQILDIVCVSIAIYFTHSQVNSVHIKERECMAVHQACPLSLLLTLGDRV